MRTYGVLQTPIGGLGVTVADGAVIEVRFGAADDHAPDHDQAADDRAPDDQVPNDQVPNDQVPDVRGGAAEVLEPALATALLELTEYFAGDRLTFDVPVRFARGSDFERAVWREIASIPYGQTRTYGEIARAVGEPGGAQAVGLACGRNPVPVIVACHRVVGAGGKLVGFGGGLPRKRQLLQLEAKVAIEQSLDPGGP